MASNPPFQVEDQNDQDFFDKLVDDEVNDEFKVTPGSSNGTSVDGVDYDKAKTFCNLNISEVGGVLDDTSGQNGEFEAKVEVVEKDVKAMPKEEEKEEHVEESGASLMSSYTFASNRVLDSSNGAGGNSVDSTVSKSSGSNGFGAKEVQWSAFNADLTQNSGNGFESYSDFFTELGEGPGDMNVNAGSSLSLHAKVRSVKTTNSGNLYDNIQYQEGHVYGTATEPNIVGQDINSYEYWENLYPGWKYDSNTGQWYQLDGYAALTNLQGNVSSNLSAEWAVSDGRLGASYLQQSSHAAVVGLAESGITESVTNWNQFPQENSGYPSHMIFDPQYPGWYYDTVFQEWRTLESYTSSVLSTGQAQKQQDVSGFASIGSLSDESDHKKYSEYSQTIDYGSKGITGQSRDCSWDGSSSNYYQQRSSMSQLNGVAKMDTISKSIGSQQLRNHHDSNFSVSNHISQQNSYNSGAAFEKPSQGFNEYSATGGSHGFVPGGNFIQEPSKPIINNKEQINVLDDYYGSQNSVNFSQQPFQSGYQISYTSTAGRSSAGRPPHALVTFGFGGKLILMKDHSSLTNPSYGSQGPVGGSISVLNIMEVITEKADASSNGGGICDYFSSLCWQSFPGPLTGGNIGGKELNKWIDERIAQCESHGVNYRKSEVLKLLFSLLKIACQHYGKFRSPFGTDNDLKGSDEPELAVARLFSFAKRNGSQFNDYAALACCLQKLPSEGQMRATAAEVQSLLVSGRKKEALHSSQEGQLWGPALILAAQLGDQFYADTVKQMALCQLVAGSPLRTLCLLIAGQPAEVFCTNNSAVSGISAAVNMSQQPTQLDANCMLDDWEENLAVIVANRTKNDELVLTHLGDCLWKERSEIVAAHICYLVAEANFEPYSSSARLCLVGADHWKFPRTYASPEAIQRTEIYECSKLLGNSQFVLLSFQPYKLIYAHMLAEVGRVSDSLKYCQVVLKYMKTGRSPEVEAWRQFAASLEERIRNHQQGGFSTNLAPAKLVGRLLNLFDSTAHRVVGGLPPMPSTLIGNTQGNEHCQQTNGPRISSSQSTLAMSSLVPSASVEHVHEKSASSGRVIMHNRSVSEPDIGRTPRQDQVDSSKDATSFDEQGKTSGDMSRFGRFGFGSQLFQRTVGLVLKPRQDRQAKLGEKNKFYYDEKLKRWVEDGAETPAEEATLPPPPTTAALQNGISDYNLNNALKSKDNRSPTQRKHGSGVPPIAPTSNQFSARGRMGVRSRYVDTFNKGGGGGGNPTNLFQSPSVPSIKSLGSAKQNFFVPVPVSPVEQSVDHVAETTQETKVIEENDPTSTKNDSYKPFIPSSSSTLRIPSMNNISNKPIDTKGNGSLLPHSRRTASWSGNFPDSFSPPNKISETKPLGEVLGMPPSSFMPPDPSLIHVSTIHGSLGDDLHEVEL